MTPSRKCRDVIAQLWLQHDGTMRQQHVVVSSNTLTSGFGNTMRHNRQARL
jgi:hypothetical protein